MTLSDQAQRERTRCVEICRRRAELWRKTARGGIGVREAGASPCENAAYLADLLESGKGHLGLAMRRPTALPKIEPMELVRQTTPFDGAGWLFEVKYDGFRSLAYIDKGTCKLVSRNDNDYSRFADLRDALPVQINAKNADPRWRTRGLTKLPPRGPPAEGARFQVAILLP